MQLCDLLRGTSRQLSCGSTGLGAPQGSSHSAGEAAHSNVPMALASILLPARSAIGVAGRHLNVWELRKAGSTVCACLLFKNKQKKKEREKKHNKKVC